MTLGRMIFAFFFFQEDNRCQKEKVKGRNNLIRSLIYWSNQLFIIVPEYWLNSHGLISTIWGSTLLFLSLLCLGLRSLTIYDPFLPEKCSWSTVLITSLLLKIPQRLPFWTKIIVPCAISPSVLLGRKAITKLDSILKKQRHHFSDKDLYSRSYSFSRNHIRIWKLDHKECWAQRIDAFQSHSTKLWCWGVWCLKSPLDYKEIKPVNPKGNQPWIFIEKINAEAEAPIL